MFLMYKVPETCLMTVGLVTEGALKTNLDSNPYIAVTFKPIMGFKKQK